MWLEIFGQVCYNKYIVENERLLIFQYTLYRMNKRQIFKRRSFNGNGAE